jgi:hypothetical protein
MPPISRPTNARSGRLCWPTGMNIRWSGALAGSRAATVGNAHRPGAGQPRHDPPADYGVAGVDAAGVCRPQHIAATVVRLLEAF